MAKRNNFSYVILWSEIQTLHKEKIEEFTKIAKLDLEKLLLIFI